MFKLVKIAALAFLLPLVAAASTTSPNSIVLTVDANGNILDMYNTSWTHNGNINQNYLDFAHTQRTWNDIDLEPGTYTWRVDLRRNNGKRGKANFDIKVKYANGRKDHPVNKKLETSRNHSGTFGLPDYRSQSSGTAGYGRVKIHIGRAAANTNCNYKITLTKTGGVSGPPTPVPPTPPNSNSYGSNNSNSSNGGCTYTKLGEKSGRVIGNTLGKLKSTKKACKSSAKVAVTKTGGKARTTMMVYKSASRNGTGTLVDSVEFPNGRARTTKYITVPNANGYFIRVELKNRSAANTFSYKAKITQ